MDREKITEVAKLCHAAMKRLGVRSSIVVIEGPQPGRPGERDNGVVGIMADVNSNVNQMANVLRSFVVTMTDQLKELGILKEVLQEAGLVVATGSDRESMQTLMAKVGAVPLDEEDCGEEEALRLMKEKLL